MGYRGAHPLKVNQGFTGASTLTGILSGNGTSAVTASAVTQYGLLVGGASNAVNSISPGVSGTVCYSPTTSANPSFKSPGFIGCPFVFLSSQTAAASATLDFTSLITTTYNSYRLLMSNVYPTTDGAFLQMLISIDNGATWIVTNYRAGAVRYNYDSTTSNSSNATTNIPLASDLTNNTANMPYSGYIDMYGLPLATPRPTFKGRSNFVNAPGVFFVLINVGTNTANSEINAIRIQCDVGNISTGKFTLYGVREE